ncbi:DUF3019 domain-containing protein [Pseudoalteromonas prydzensis]|uniref:DUF3019 domain-containing protein n=1 Tax=Pseudoalteromonas prydzensis TaxID=182141 RepID=UPI00142F35D6|nr:DUF3019 domain-containing protein [Pseudoalteromonas prydzensis]
MKNLHKILIYIICIYSVISSINSFAKSTEKPFFKVSPTVCITEAKQALCELNIQVSFILAPFKELCLEISNRPQYTQCYAQSGLIEERFKINTNQSLKVQLIDPLTNLIIKEQELSIASYEAKDYRIKRRFGWSL